MKIGIFAYNFPHKKTQEGLLHLFSHNIPIACILAADPVELKFYQSKIRVAPKGLEYLHPKEIASQLKTPYHVVIHNSTECETLIKRYDLDVGIILGARILKENVIKAFKIGILNLHPGLLPHNRGLDNIKWAILKNYKQGVSAHLIDGEIDKGKVILKQEIPIFEDDTLLDVFLRIQNKEQVLMIEALKILAKGNGNFEKVTEGEYEKSVPPELEKELMEKFEWYKRNYGKL